MPTAGLPARIDRSQEAIANRFRRIWWKAGGNQASAVAELNRARELLGQHGFGLVVTVCGERKPLHEICRTRRERETTTDMLRIHLGTLAKFWRPGR